RRNPTKPAPNPRPGQRLKTPRPPRPAARGEPRMSPESSAKQNAAYAGLGAAMTIGSKTTSRAQLHQPHLHHHFFHRRGTVIDRDRRHVHILREKKREAPLLDQHEWSVAGEEFQIGPAIVRRLHLHS